MDQRKPANRHHSRNDGVSRSIDFVFHTELKGAKLASDGGSFPVGAAGFSSNAVKRLGTAESGHGRQFLITDFQKSVKKPHFSDNYERTFKKSPQAFSFKRSEFSDICNSRN